jgi:hypothetical protein
MKLSKYVYRWSLVPPRFWLKWWHWNTWSLTRFESPKGHRNGAWLVWLGPLQIVREFNLKWLDQRRDALR